MDMLDDIELPFDVEVSDEQLNNISLPYTSALAAQVGMSRAVFNNCTFNLSKYIAKNVVMYFVKSKQVNKLLAIVVCVFYLVWI